MDARPSPRARQVLLVLLGTAVAVSVVHYVDNVVNYADYPQPGPGDLPAPSAATIGAAWFVLTAFGVAGLLLFLRGRVVPAAACLTVYSVSGLVGFAHYSVPGATEMVWWRQTHVVTDIALGLAVLGFALWLASGRSA